VCLQVLSYMLEKSPGDEAGFSRNVRKKTEIFMPVDDYPSDLYDMLAALCRPVMFQSRKSLVLTPALYNSAYFEHLPYLAQANGCELVEAQDWSWV